jgi:hypothetical protein
VNLGREVLRFLVAKSFARRKHDDYTLLDLTGACDTTALEMAFDRIGAPLEVLHLDEPTFAMCMVLIAVAASGSSYFLAR